MISFETLKNAFAAREFFADKTWRTSPVAFPISAQQFDELQKIGVACHAFYRAQETLYTRSANGKKILRNSEFTAPWIAEYLERGKPAGVIAHGKHRALKNMMPVILRPDLLITENGFSLTEMDAVPGGIGLTAFLNSIYANDTDLKNDTVIIGGENQPELFFQSIAALAPDVENPLIAIVVSDEAATYRPEFEWLAAKLREKNRRVFCAHPGELIPLGGAIFTPVNGTPERVDIIYRFFELFDLGNVKGADAIFDAVEAGSVILTPPMKASQEEKLNLALLYHPALAEFWRENLTEENHTILKKIVPRTWIMENVELPPVAVLHAPNINGKPLRAWMELADASQKERNFIIKASGFHETAWGAKSVILGSDISRDEWLAAIEDATDSENETFYILQDYHKPVRLRHTLHDTNGTVREEDGRVRLCPYYFIQNGTAELGAILATFCPADKKIIHGMKDAALLPCAMQKN